MKKRVLTTLLALCVTFTSIPVDGLVYAQEVVEQNTEVLTEATEQIESLDETGATERLEELEETELSEDLETIEMPEVLEETETTEEEQAIEDTEMAEKSETTEQVEETVEDIEASESTEVVEDAEVAESTEASEPAEVPEETEATEDTEIAEVEEAKLNYIMVESDYIETPATQNIVASIGTEERELSDIKLLYQNLITQETYDAAAVAKAEDMVLFSISYEDESQTGVYQLTAITYKKDGRELRVELDELNMDVRYGVNKEVETTPDQILVDEEMLEETHAVVDASVVTMDEEGNITSENTVEDVLGSSNSVLGAVDDMKASSGGDLVVMDDMKASSGGDLVVMIDPGHDNEHAGAQYNNAGEEDLVFKIASYCKEELETYSGVIVYMTHDTISCPNGGYNVSSGDCNLARVALAKSVGVDVFVSFHLNANTDTSANGVGVYYPNSNYNAEIGKEGEKLAKEIFEKLTALGLKKWSTGTIIWNATYDKYEDGSVADYLGIIRNCKKEGIPAVLIEHAFISGTSDFQNFLSSDEKLKSLGVADATAIAETYGLSKRTGKPEIAYTQSQADGTLKISWNAAQDAVSYKLYRSAKKDSGYTLLAEVKDATSYTDKSATVGKRYYYAVSAVYSNGVEGEKGSPVAGRVLAQTAISYVKSKSAKTLEIAWGEVTGAAGYRIYRKNPDTGKFDKIATVDSGSTTTYVDSVAANNKEYTYKIQAYNKSGSKVGVGAYSAELSGKSVAKPKITSVNAVDYKTLKVTWKKVSGASGYEIMRSTKKDSGFKKIAAISSGSTTSYADDTVKSGKTYYYKVQAVNSNNGKKGVSGYSTVVSGKTIGRTSIASVVAKDNKTLTITWKEVSEAYGYRILRSTSKNGTYKTVKTIKSAKTTSYQDSKVETGKTYYYKIETLIKNNDEIGTSGVSAAVKGCTVAKTEINYVVSAGSDTLEINWKSVDGAWGYRIKRSTSKTGTYKTIKTIEGVDKTTYKDKKVSTGKTYYYKVEVINKVNGDKGYSGNSAAVSGKTLAKTSITKVTTTDSNSIELTWKKVSGASGYQIYRSNSKNGTYKQIDKVSGAKTTKYKDTSAEAGKTYYYKVRAYKKNDQKTGVGTFTAMQKAWTLKAVTFSSISGTSGNKVTLKWNKVSKASGYQIYRSTKEKSGFKMIKEIKSGDTISYKDTGVKAGKVYYYKVVATTQIKGSSAGYGNYSVTMKVPILAEAKITKTSVKEDNSLQIEWGTIKNADGYQLSYSTEKDGSYKKLVNTDAKAYNHVNVASGTTYYYKLRAYATLSNGNKVYSAWSDIQTVTSGYEIMGKSTLTVNQMVSYYNSKNYTYPSEVYAAKGASDATEFFAILKEEADAEGVKAEVLFAQVMLETGGLQFGGDVKAEQCNFGGLGATGNGVTGETFVNIRTGLRAQTQHLKAYASTEPLNKECVDSRFKYVSRGCAPYIEWLSIPNNPYGKGWAADANYAPKLLKIIEDVKGQ